MRWIPALLLAATVSATAACGTAPSRSGGQVTLVDEDAPDERFVIRRSTLDEALNRGPSWLIQRVRVDPVVIDEEFYGFRIRSILDGVPGFERDSVRPGDIVQRVNGQPIGRPEQFMQVWESLAHARHISVRLLRSGHPLRITWMIREDTGEGAARAGQRSSR